MTIVSIILIVYVFYILITKNKKESLVSLFTLYCVFSTFITTGYFLKLGSVIITFSQFLLTVLFLFYILYFPKEFKQLIKKKDNRIPIALLLGIVILFNIAKLFLSTKSIMVMPNSNGDIYIWKMVQAELNINTIQKCINLFIFSVVIIFTSYIIDEELWFVVKEKYVSFGNFMVIYCIFEFLYNNIISNSYIRRFITYVFGNTGSQYTTIISRGGIFCIQGFNKEPSHIAVAFFILEVIILLSKEFTNFKKVLYSMVILFIMFLSGSFTGALCSIISVIIYLVTLKRIPLITCILGIVMSMAVLLYIQISIENSLLQYYLMRVKNFFSILEYAKPAMNKNDALLKVQSIQYYFANGGNGGSEYMRLSSILYNLDLFYQNMLLGVGLGTTNTYGMIPSILANIGIVGGFLWYKMIVYGKSFNSKSQKVILFILVCTLFFCGDIGWLFNISVIMLVYSISYYKR